MTAALRLALLGYGFAGKTFHAPLIRNTPGLELDAVASSRPAAVLAELPASRPFADFAQVLADPAIDAVVIATPNDTHAAIAEAALLAGKHVVVDKPLTLTLAHARRLGKLAEECGRVLSVFHNRRWDSDFLALQEVLGAGLIGRPTHVESRFDRFRPTVRQRWREKAESGGGVWFDLGPHLVDQALQLFGLPLRLGGSMARLRDAAEADDWFQILLDYGRVQVTLSSSMLVAGGIPRLPRTAREAAGSSMASTRRRTSCVPACCREKPAGASIRRRPCCSRKRPVSRGSPGRCRRATTCAITPGCAMRCSAAAPIRSRRRRPSPPWRCSKPGSRRPVADAGWNCRWSTRNARHSAARACRSRRTLKKQYRLSKPKDPRIMYKIVLLRHGESTWNKENRFTGWTDVDLTEQGVGEAVAAGKLLASEGFAFDLAYTSVLKRANKTLNVVLEQLDALWLPVEHSWRLNERHYGAGPRQGRNRGTLRRRPGACLAPCLRYPPPALEEGDERLALDDPRYASLPGSHFPRTECLKDTVARVVPYWETVIVPQILAGKRIIIAAHGNSLQALIKYLDGVSDEAIVGLNIPTAQPLVYELDADLAPIKNYYLADEETIRAAQTAVANQGKAKA